MTHFFLPEAASTFGAPFDHFAIFMIVLCGTTTLGIFATIFAFIVKFHHEKGEAELWPGRRLHWLEWAWTLIPLGIFTFIFWWGARVYLQIEDVPQTGLPIFVVAKQWMWQTEHSGGQKEINELHVPVGRAVRLSMISQDVIHSFFVPAFRIKQDVLPGRYTYAWFTATQEGRFHLLCAEFCGTDHSAMTGWVTVMSSSDYAKWLETNANIPASKREDVDEGSLVQLGRDIYEKSQCVSCHSDNARAPALEDVYGHAVHLSDGSVITADENYLMESILRPSAKVVEGYADVMPSFQGQLSDREVRGLVEYFKTISDHPKGKTGTHP